MLSNDAPLLDTHIWFWYLTGSDRLPKHFEELIDSHIGTCWISAISVWELAMLADKGQIKVRGPFRDWAKLALELFPVRIAPVNHEIAIRSRELDLPHQDPADRFIAATALTYELKLLTVDSTLREWAGVETP